MDGGFLCVALLLTLRPILLTGEEGRMAVYQYVNAERSVAQVVVRGDWVYEVPPRDLTFFVASAEDEMEVYARDSARGPRRLVESGKVSKLASRVQMI
jgi:hypothetical protein